MQYPACLPDYFAGMNYLIFLVLSFFIPSSSGLATLSMSIMSPLADFAGVGRGIVIIAYQSANAMISLIAPTCGLLMGVLAMTQNFFWNVGTLRVEAVSVYCDRYRTGTCISLCVPVLKQIEVKDDERKTTNEYRTY